MSPVAKRGRPSNLLSMLNWRFSPPHRPADGRLLPPRHVAHVRQLVRDSLVTIDTGLLSGKEEALVRVDGTRALPRDVHRLRAVAIAALQRVVRLHARPFVHRKLEPVIEKFLARIDGAEELAPDLFRRLHLAGDLVRPF